MNLGGASHEGFANMVEDHRLIKLLDMITLVKIFLCVASKDVDDLDSSVFFSLTTNLCITRRYVIHQGGSTQDLDLYFK